MNGYERPHRLTIEARADYIESVAGMTEDDVVRELDFALGESLHELRHTEHDADEEASSLRWTAVLVERRLVDLGVPEED